MKNKFILLCLIVTFALLTGCSKDSDNSDKNGTVYVNGKLLTDTLIEEEGYEKIYTYQLYDGETIDIYDSYLTWDTVKIMDGNQKIKNATINGLNLEYKPLVEIYNMISKNDTYNEKLDIWDKKSHDRIPEEQFNDYMISPDECASVEFYANGSWLEIEGCNMTENEVSLKSIYPTEGVRVSSCYINDVNLKDITMSDENSQQLLVDTFGKPYAIEADDEPVIKGSLGTNIHYYYKIDDNWLLNIDYSAQYARNSTKIFYKNGGAWLIPYTTSADEKIGIGV